MNVKKSRVRQKGTPRALFIGAGILLIIAGAAWFNLIDGSTAGTTGPRLAVDTDRIDFGKQPFNKRVRADFKITNTGDRDLTLDATTPVGVVEGC